MADQTQPKSIMICTPAFGCLVTTGYVTSVMLMRIELARRGISTQLFLLGSESLITRARNLCTAQFLKSGCTHMLFIDADISFDGRAINAMLDFDKDVVTAIYSKKTFDWERFRAVSTTQDCKEPVMQRALDWNLNIVQDEPIVDGRFVRVHDAATGLWLQSRSSILKMQKAYPALLCKNDIPGISKDIPTYYALFDAAIDPQTRRYHSEDYEMCRRLQLIGIDIWADIAVPLTHTGNYHFRPDCKELLKPLN